MEARHIEIGAVTGIQGTRWFEVEVNGRSAHAGTTPMSRRADAISAAIDIIIDLRRIAVDPEGRLGSPSDGDVVPNTANAVPEQVRFTIDMRHPEQQVLEDRTRAIVARCTGTSGGCRDRGPRGSDATTLRLSRSDRGSGREYRACPAGVLHAPAVGCLSRCVVRGSHLSDRHDFRAVSRRHQSQSDRVCRTGASRRGCTRAGGNSGRTCDRRGQVTRHCRGRCPMTIAKRPTTWLARRTLCGRERWTFCIGPWVSWLLQWAPIWLRVKDQTFSVFRRTEQSESHDADAPGIAVDATRTAQGQKLPCQRVRVTSA